MSDFIKHDSNKPQPFKGVFQYFPKALMAVAIVSGYGAKKYEWGNWAKARGADRYWEALTRHFLALCGGETLDEESGLRHIAHLAWNALAVLELELRQEKENGSQRIQPQPGDGPLFDGGLSGPIAGGNGACDEVAKRSGSDPVADQSSSNSHFKSPCRFCAKNVGYPCKDVRTINSCFNWQMAALEPVPNTSDPVADQIGQNPPLRRCQYCEQDVVYPCKNAYTSIGCLTLAITRRPKSNSDEVAEPSSPKSSDIVANPSGLITTCKVCGGNGVFCKACMPLL